jgi:hypothetical protein
MDELVWNNDVVTMRYSDKSLFQWHFVHHKFHMVWPLI